MGLSLAPDGGLCKNDLHLVALTEAELLGVLVHSSVDVAPRKAYPQPSHLVEQVGVVVEPVGKGVDIVGIGDVEKHIAVEEL